jgi:hypothetical protein
MIADNAMPVYLSVESLLGPSLVRKYFVETIHFKLENTLVWFFYASTILTAVVIP